MSKVTAGRDRFGNLAPQFAALNDNVLFGQVWSREADLSAKYRSMITVSSLMSLGLFEQLPHHIQKAKINGVSLTEMVEIVIQLAFYAGWQKAWSTFQIVKDIYINRKCADHG